MKMPGLDKPEPNTRILVFKRPAGKWLTFTVKAVERFDEFQKLCPTKKPGWEMDASGKKTYQTNTPEYQKYLAAQNKKFEDWLIIESITEPSQIEWDTVDRSNPETYANWETEFIQMGISAGERRRIQMAVEEINNITDQSLQDTAADFLSMAREEAEKLKEEIYLLIEQVNTQSTELVKDSESSLPESEFQELPAGTPSQDQPSES